MTSPSFSSPHRVCAMVAMAALFAACGPKPEAPSAGAGQGGGAPPAMPAGVITVKLAPLPLSTELPGRLEPLRMAQVRARTPGIVQQRRFQEGSMVRAGEVLFTLDAGTQRANVASAQAAAVSAQANVAQASAQVERNRPLVEARAISQQEWLATTTALKQAQAQAASSQAAIDAARVALSYTTVTAPIAGRIGRAQVSEGALVSPSDPTPMAVIQQTQTLYVNFTQSASEVMQLRRAVESGRVRRLGADAVEAQLVLDDGSVYPHPVKLLFADPTVDPTTGQVTLRAEVPNASGALLPGLFVKVRLAQAVGERAVRVPQQAVTRGGSGDSVLVLGQGNVPAPRKVRIAGADNGYWLVIDGLTDGEQVVVDGFQKLRPGAPVTPVPWAPPAAKPAVGAPQAAASAAPAASAAAAGASR